MSRFLLVVALVLPLTALAQRPPVARHIETEGVRANSEDCALGVVYDDGEFLIGYSVGDGEPGAATMVMKFDVPSGTTALDQVCTCFSPGFGAPPTMDYEVVLYDDDGPGGKPGTFLGAVDATMTFPFFIDETFSNVSLAGSGITLPDKTVYVGARWPGGETAYLCGDRSPGTAQRSNYLSGDRGASWQTIGSLFTDVAPRALGIRVDPAGGSPGTCTPSSTAMCLGGNRFKVEATWQTAGASGNASVVRLTEDSGYFWFFAQNNVESLVKVIDGCSVNSRFWLFAAGLTDAGVTVTVTDTKTGQVKTYTNPLGTPFAPIQDTSAFATCP